MKILFLSPNQITRWNPGHQQFRNAIANFHDVKYYGEGYQDHVDNEKRYDLCHILKYYLSKYHWKPEMIMTYGYRYTLPFRGLGETNIPKAHFICDFTPAVPGWRGTINYYYPMLLEHQYDIHFAMSYQVINWFKNNWSDRKVCYLPFGVDETVFRPLNVSEPQRDVYVGWSHHDAIYPLRRRIEDTLHDRLGDELRILFKKIFGHGFVRAINNALINMNTSNVFRTMNMKNFEVMACNRVLMTERVQEMDDLGFKPLVHYVDYTSMADMVNKIKTLVDHPNLTSSIAQAGYELTLRENTNNQRVMSMTRRINEYL